jgi:hypothetical protein
MKNSIYSIALAALFLFGCKQSPTESDPMRVNDPNHPTTNDGPNSITDIPTPSYNGNTVSTIDEGYQICLTWVSNTPAASYTTNPTDANNFDHDAEYWGTTQNSIVGPGSDENHPNQPYSGHYEIYRDGVKIADVTGNAYCDTVSEGGTYTYTVKSKSLEGVQPNAMTHHSLESEGYEVSVGCEYVIGVVGTGAVNSDEQILTNSSNKNANNYNLIFQLYFCDLVTEDAGIAVYLYNPGYNGGVAKLLQLGGGSYNNGWDPTDDSYHVQIPNPDKGDPSTSSLIFKDGVGGTTLATWTFEIQ